MTDLSPFADIKQVVVTLLGDLATTATRTDDDLADTLPFIRIATRGGSDDRITDRRLVDVDVFADSEKAADDLAELVRQRFLSLPAVVTLPGGSKVVLDAGNTVSAPQIVPWSASEQIERSVATYSVASRRF